MGSESYHEPLELLSERTRNLHRAIVSLIEELEAVDWYGQRAEAASDPELKAVLLHHRTRGDRARLHEPRVAHPQRRRPSPSTPAPICSPRGRSPRWRRPPRPRGATGAAPGRAPPRPTGSASLAIGSLKTDEV